MRDSPSVPASAPANASDLPHGLLPPRPGESESVEDLVEVSDEAGTTPAESEEVKDLHGEQGHHPGGDRGQARDEDAPVAAGSEADAEGAPAGGDPDEAPGGQPPSADLELVVSARDADDDVHFAVAAKALGVSRKTIERMVKRDQLLRGPSGASATVSKRSLVALLEDRRGSQGSAAAHPAPIETAIEQAHPPSATEPVEVRPIEAVGSSPDIVRSALEPWIEEIVSSRTQSAMLQKEVERLTDRSARERARDQLLLELTAGNWLQRRRARKDALRRVILERDESDT